MNYRTEITINKIVSVTLVSAVLFAESFLPAVSAPANWCKGREQSTCNAEVACAWRETITDGVSKTSCIYNAKAAREFVAKHVTE